MRRALVTAAMAMAAHGCATAAGDSDDPEGADAAGLDPRSDAGGEAPGDAAPPGGALDPDLDPAAPGGAVCATPGSMTECGNTEVCRFFDSATGRCESCTSCGNLGASCSSSQECDILFMCYRGSCTNFCTLGSTECGPPEDCLDVGHPERGVCTPL